MLQLLQQELPLLHPVQRLQLQATLRLPLTLPLELQLPFLQP